MNYDDLVKFAGRFEKLAEVRIPTPKEIQDRVKLPNQSDAIAAQIQGIPIYRANDGWHYGTDPGGAAAAKMVMKEEAVEEGTPEVDHRTLDQYVGATIRQPITEAGTIYPPKGAKGIAFVLNAKVVPNNGIIWAKGDPEKAERDLVFKGKWVVDKTSHYEYVDINDNLLGLAASSNLQGFTKSVVPEIATQLNKMAAQFGSKALYIKNYINKIPFASQLSLD